MKLLRRLCCGLVVLAWATPAVAGHPFFSYFAQRHDGPYAAPTPRYVLVDPTPVDAPYGPHHGQHAAHHARPAELWQRRDLTRPTYPYGWFGAGSHTTQHWSNTGYYDNYVESRTLVGR